MATSEPEINIALAEVLDSLRSNWRVGGEQLGRLRGSHRQPDILVTAEGAAPVVIETEVMPAVTVEDDALARLGETLSGSGQEVTSVVAVRIPLRFRDLAGERLRTALREAATIEYALLTGRTRETYQRFPDAGWLTGGASDLARLTYQAGVPRNAVDAAADRLEQGVTAAAERLNEAIQLRPDIGPWIADRLHQEDGGQTHRMAMTVITNALVFHENLAGSHGIVPPGSLRTPSGRFSSVAVQDEWRKILNVNYYPIFDIARQILELIPEGLAADVLGTLAATAQELIREGVTRSHDLSGVVFQRLIADRKFLATFYTTPSAAALLAILAMPERSDEALYTEFRVADFSCGTGTLLSAAYRRLLTLHEAHGGNSAQFHRSAMEGSIVGTDIMPMSVHLTASMLASAYPSEQFSKTRLYTLPYGRQQRGHYALGSLDLLAEDARIRPLFRTGAPVRTTGWGSEEITQELDITPGEFDLVIMNPPFTRPTNHSGVRTNIPNPAFAGLGTDKDEQDQMASLAKSLGQATCASGNAGLASYFIALADKMAADSGTVAMVLPLAVLQGQSWQKARDLWRKQYSNIIVVSIAGEKSHEKSFSADTGLGEVLIVAKKQRNHDRDNRGLFVNLARRPRTPMEGEEIGGQILRLAELSSVRRLEDGPYGGSRISVGQELVDEVLDCPLPEGGQWPVAGMTDLSLAQVAYQLTLGRLWLPALPDSDAHPLPITPLNDIGSLGFLDRDINGKAGRGAFNIVTPWSTSSTFPTLWGHDAPRERAMVVDPDSEAAVRIGKEPRTHEIWETRSRTHHNRDFRFNSQALTVAFTESPTLGGRSWPNLILNHPSWEPVYTLWANSTLGVLLYWWHSSKQDSGRGMMPRLQAASMHVLNVDVLSDAQIEQANDIFGDLKYRQMLPFNEAYKDEIRKELDYRLLVDILGMPSALVPSLDLLREKLCAEPSIHGGKKSKSTNPSPQSRMAF